MTKHFPVLAHEYNIMPWHYGGDRYLTWDEMESFARDLNRRAKEAKEAARKTKRRR